MEDGKITMRAGERFISTDETTGLSVNLCVKCSDKKKVGLCPCKLYIDIETKLLDTGTPIDIKAGVGKGGREVDVIDAQGVFEKLEREKEPMRHLRSEKCPRKCKQRAINLKNDGGCNPENCIKLTHKAKALTAVSLATGVDNKPKKRRLRKYDSRDRRLLIDVTSYGKLTSGPKYRFVERNVIKQQAKELGFKLPPLRTGERSKFAKGLPLPPRHLTAKEISHAQEQLKKIASKDAKAGAMEVRSALNPLPQRRGLPPPDKSKRGDWASARRTFAKIEKKEPLKPLPPRLGICPLHVDKLKKEAKKVVKNLKGSKRPFLFGSTVVTHTPPKIVKTEKVAKEITPHPRSSGTLEEWSKVILKDIPKERLVALGGGTRKAPLKAPTHRKDCLECRSSLITNDGILLCLNPLGNLYGTCNACAPRRIAKKGVPWKDVPYKKPRSLQRPGKLSSYQIAVLEHDKERHERRVSRARARKEEKAASKVHNDLVEFQRAKDDTAKLHRTKTNLELKPSDLSTLQQLTKAAVVKRLKEEIESRSPFVVDKVGLERIKLEILAEFKPFEKEPKWLLDAGYDLIKKEAKSCKKKTKTKSKRKSKKAK